MKRLIKGCLLLVCVCVMVFSIITGVLASTSASSVLQGWNGSSYQYILFGQYASGSKTPEPVLWRVLYTTNDRALLVSEYILAARPFDGASPDWEGSEIQDWLNSTFLHDAFSSRQDYGALVRNKELGRVFLLSREDLANEDYGFSKDEEHPDDPRRAMGTNRAISSGLWRNEEGYSTYYTRTMRGRTSLYQIRTDGSFGEARIGRKNVGIRPAVRIDLDKVSFSSGDGTLESPYR